MKQNTAFQTMAVLANVNELSAAVLKSVVGNELADSMNGEPVRNQAVYNLAMAEVQKTFNAVLEVK